MTEFTDVPEINTLYSERLLVDQAIRFLDTGGNLTQFVIEAGPNQFAGPARVAMPPPTPPDTIANIRAWLVQRQADIDMQLADLGVVNPPAKRV